MSPESGRGTREVGLGPLTALKADPGRAAILTDVDGTLAPIVGRPEEAAVPARATQLLQHLSESYGLVGCISGRQAEEARRLVGAKELAYVGNHGLELLRPGEGTPELDPALSEQRGDAAAFVAELDPQMLAKTELRLEDKGPIQALHWRGAERQDVAEEEVRRISLSAAAVGLVPHWGRKVLELRPPGGGGKDAAVGRLLSGRQLRYAIYAGDDRTDLDAFRRLRELHEAGSLEAAICVGVVSEEGPPELAAEADLRVDGPAGWLALLEKLAV